MSTIKEEKISADLPPPLESPQYSPPPSPPPLEVTPSAAGRKKKKVTFTFSEEEIKKTPVEISSKKQLLPVPPNDLKRPPKDTRQNCGASDFKEGWCIEGTSKRPIYKTKEGIYWEKEKGKNICHYRLPESEEWFDIKPCFREKILTSKIFWIVLGVILVLIIIGSIIIWKYFSGANISLFTSDFSSDIKAASNLSLVPTFINSKTTVIFGPPGFNSSTDNLVSRAFDIPEVVSTFTVSISFDIKRSPQQTNIIISEIGLIDFCIIYVNGSVFRSFPDGYSDISIGTDINTPVILQTASQASKATGKDLSNVQIDRKGYTLLNLSQGRNTVTFKYTAIGSGAIYFKIDLFQTD